MQVRGDNSAQFSEARKTGAYRNLPYKAFRVGPKRRFGTIPGGRSCPCAGCGKGGRCYTEVQKHQEAFRSRDPLARFAALALNLAIPAVSATGGAWLPLDPYGNAAGMIAYEGHPWRVPPAPAWLEYIHYYREFDPFGRAGTSGQSHSVMTIANLGGYETFTKTIFGGEYLPEIGFPYVAVMNLHVGGRLAARVVVARTADEADFTADEAALMRRLVPVLEVALEHVLHRSSRGDSPEIRSRMPLTRREAEVATLVAHGATNEEIARSLNISLATVKTHLNRAFAKLGVRTRVELARRVSGQPRVQ